MSLLQKLFGGGQHVPAMTNTELEARLAGEGSDGGAKGGEPPDGQARNPGGGGPGPREVRALTVVDVREAEELTGPVIEGAVHIPLSRLPNRLDDLDIESDIVLVCRSGNRSYLAALQLMGYGFQRVWNLQGGMLAWTGPTTRVQPS